MKLINAALAEKNVKSKELTNEIQEKIARHKEMIIKYNLACESTKMRKKRMRQLKLN